MWRYYAFRIAGLTIAHLPRKAGYWIAHVVAYLVYISSPALRTSIRDNMQHVLGPEASDAALKRHVRAVLRNAARNYFDLIKLPHMKLSDIESCIVVHDWHNLEDSLKKGKGVILATAHLGSFDTAIQILAARSIKTTVLVEPLKPPALLSHVTAIREKYGIDFAPAQLDVLKVLIRSLHRGEVVLLACDRDIAKNGLRSKFFGEKTLLPTVAVRIAMRTGAAIVPAFNLRRKDGRYDVYFEPAVDIVTAGNCALTRNVEQVTHAVEKYIKSCPDQWVVLSPIWASEQ